MARSAFGGTNSDWLFDPFNFGERELLALRTLTTSLDFYSAETGGTHYTDLLDASAAAVSHIDVTGHQVPRFSGPDGILGMWVDKNDGSPREYMEARDLAGAAAALVDAEGFKDDAETAAAAAAASAASIALPTSAAVYGVLPAASAATNATGFTAAAAALNAGTIKSLWIPAGTYNILKTEGQNLMALSGVDGIRIVGDGAILNDTTTYTNGGAFTTMFHFTDCQDVEVRGIEYVGPAIGTPGTNHGYQGAIFVRAVTGCDGVTVDARLTNLRYGVQTGEYGDATKGGCKNLDVTLRGTMVGYGIAAYYATGIRHDLDLDGVHRVAYIAGCEDVRGVARFKNTYIASPTYLLTDCLTSGTDAAAELDPITDATTSRGCANVDIESIDTGSTTWNSGGITLAGITLSRVDAVQFRNIKIRVYSKAVGNTTSAYSAAFLVLSDAKSVWARYPFNWESTIVLEDIEVSGLLDRSSSTLASAVATPYVVAHESTHAATVRNIRFSDLTMLKSSHGSNLAGDFHAPGLAGPAIFDGFHTPGLGLTIYTNETYPTTLRNSVVGSLTLANASAQSSALIIEAGTKVESASTYGMRDDPYALDSGQSSFPRGLMNSVANLTTNVRLAYFIGSRSFVATQVRFRSGTTASVTPTLVRVGLYTVAANGDLTLIASTANDTALLAATATTYTKAFSVSVTIVTGQAYAIGILTLAATNPTIEGQAFVSSFPELIIAPRVSGVTAAVSSNLPTSVASGDVSANSQRPYIAILP